MNEHNQMINSISEWTSAFLRRSIADFLKFNHKHGLSMSQSNVPMKLYYDGATTILSLRQGLDGSRSAVTQMVDKLVDMGLVNRSETPEDRRVKMICLTDEGKTLVEEGIESRQNWIKPLVDNFSTEEQTRIAETLQKLTSAALALAEDQDSQSY